MNIKVEKMQTESVVKAMLKDDKLMKEYTEKKYNRMAEGSKTIEEEKHRIKELKRKEAEILRELENMTKEALKK